METKHLLRGLLLATIVLFGLNLSAQSPKEKSDANGKKTVSWYLVENVRSASEVSNTNLANVRLATKPVFTSDEIVQYNTTTHSFRLTDEAYERIHRLAVPAQGSAFVVTVGERRVYSGAFWTILSSAIWDGIAITQPFLEKEGQKELKILKGTTAKTDLRNDAEVLEILKSRGEPAKQ